MADERGRPAPSVTVFAGRPDEAVLEHYAAAGIDRCVLMLPPQPATEVIPRLDRYRELAGAWLGYPPEGVG
jgi:hypothetical protein